MCVWNSLESFDTLAGIGVDDSVVRAFSEKPDAQLVSRHGGHNWSMFREDAHEEVLLCGVPSRLPGKSCLHRILSAEP